MATRPVSPYKDRDEAARNGHARFFTGEECKHGHRAERFTANGGCVLCVNRKVASLPTGRNVRPLPRPLIFPAAGPAPTPELMDWLQSRIERALPELVAEYQAATAPAQPVDPLAGTRRTAKMPDDATLAAFVAQGWTRETLLTHGYLELIPQPTE